MHRIGQHKICRIMESKTFKIGVNIGVGSKHMLARVKRHRVQPGSQVPFAIPCLDWSERRYHLAGALGAALMERLLQLRWIERFATGRAVRLTESGQEGITRALGNYFQW